MKNIKFLSTIAFMFVAVLLIGQTRDIGNFSEIKASASVSIKLVKADKPGLEYKMIKGSADRLITKVEGDKLIVKIKSSMGWNNAQAKVIVYYTQLNGVYASAGASIKSDDILVSDDMDLEASSGASISLEIDADRVRGEASSGASLSLSGKAKKVNLDASSGSSIKGIRLVCDDAKADVSSGATIEIHANKSINAEASSGGSIRYSGDADDSKIDRGWSGQIKRIRG